MEVEITRPSITLIHRTIHLELNYFPFEVKMLLFLLFAVVLPSATSVSFPPSRGSPYYKSHFVSWSPPGPNDGYIEPTIKQYHM